VKGTEEIFEREKRAGESYGGVDGGGGRWERRTKKGGGKGEWVRQGSEGGGSNGEEK